MLVVMVQVRRAKEVVEAGKIMAKVGQRKKSLEDDDECEDDDEDSSSIAWNSKQRRHCFC